MIYRIIICIVFLFLNVASAQQFLTDPIHHLSFKLPSGWTYTKNDSAGSFQRFECFNPEQTTMLEIYALKSQKPLNLKNFADVITSDEKGFGKSFGKIQSTQESRISGIKTIEKNYKNSTKIGREIDVNTLLLIKGKYGYIIVFRIFSDTKDRNDLQLIKENFDVKIPRSLFSWLILFGFIGVSLYALILAGMRLIFWLRPVNLFALAYCFFVIILALLALTIIFTNFQTIGLWVCLISGGI